MNSGGVVILAPLIKSKVLNASQEDRRWSVRQFVYESIAPGHKRQKKLTGYVRHRDDGDNALSNKHRL